MQIDCPEPGMNPPDLTEVEPFTIVKRPEETGGEFTRLEVTVHPARTANRTESGLAHARWAADTSDEHVNPKWEERFKVRVGEYRVVCEGTETTLTAGEELTLPPDVPHRHWNPTPKPARLVYEARPGTEADELFETVYTLAQLGYATEDGFPKLLQFAVIQDAYPGYFYSTDLPRSVQRAAFKLLAPLGRLAGYKPTYSRDEIETLG